MPLTSSSSVRTPTISRRPSGVVTSAVEAASGAICSALFACGLRIGERLLAGFEFLLERLFALLLAFQLLQLALGFGVEAIFVEENAHVLACRAFRRRLAHPRGFFEHHRFQVLVLL